LTATPETQIVGIHVFQYLGALDTSSARVAPVQPAEQDVRAEPAPAERVEGESSVLDAAARRLGRVVLLIAAAVVAVYALVLLFEVVALVPVAKAGPSAAEAIPILGASALVASPLVAVPRFRDWTWREAVAVTATIVAAVMTSVVVKAWFVPPSLDVVTIRTRTGEELSPVRLLGTSDGFVYILEGRQGAPGPPGITAIPSDEISSMKVRQGTPRTYRTLPQLLGADHGLFRLRFDGHVNVPTCRWFTSLMRDLCNTKLP
jgi:hypothetical protein